jgi:hypothetical protein
MQNARSVVIWRAQIGSYCACFQLYRRNVHVALYFPGGSIPGQDPFDERLAWITIRALEGAGAVVVPVRYDDDVIAPDQERFESGVRRDVTGALAFYRPDRVTLVGKSRGTYALALLCTEQFEFPDDTRLIWLTPVWHSDGSWNAAQASPYTSLYVVGLADHQFHDAERHAAVRGETLEIASADHRLEVAGDIFATLDAWRTMAQAVARFAARN